MQSFKNLAEGTFDEAFAKIVHTKLYQIRLLRHNPQGFGRRAGQRRALTGAPALMPELLVLALAAAGRVPDDGCFAAAAAHNVVVSKNIQD
ncbi:hypothetical protein [Undibacterium sp. WLX3042]|uniref:hypothetical protein n=1 Tax=Undibacterium sp. WLX3042 TaxID=3412686 RepID=UPI003C2BD559